MMPLLLAVIAVVSSVAAWRAWTGRWTSWARQAFSYTIPIHLLPGVGASAAVAAAAELIGGDLPLWTLFVILPAMILMAVGLAGFFGELPEWTTPRWYQEMDRTQPDLHEPLTALLVARATQVAPLTDPFGAEPPQFRWHANWFYDPSPDAPMAHGLSVGFGAVAGRLTGHRSGLAFRSTKEEAALLPPEFAALDVPREQLLAVYTVPPRCGADGVRMPTPLMRRLKRPDPRRRVVVRTNEGIVIFAMYSARKRADEIASTFDIERRPDA